MGRAHKVRTPERELDAALARAKQLESEEIRVARANYEEKTDIISLTLTNGATTSFPRKWLEGLEPAEASQLSQIELLGGGTALYWPELNVSHYVLGLLNNVFGTNRWMAHLGRLGGAARSKTKTDAARANGLRGGRPKKDSNAGEVKPAYKVGQVVSLRVDPVRRGPVVEVLSPVGGKPRYRVFHSASEIREYHEDQLVSAGLASPEQEMRSALGSRRWVGVPEFQCRLTSARLSHPQTDSLYALHSARIRYIPFQFKPLLRLLRADQPRLLIADDVGVGKTIEAGLILKELATRQRVENVLVVCPKALVQKWHSEMRRFDEDFRILSPDTLKYCLRETNLDGFWPQEYARAILPLELARMEEYLIGDVETKRAPGFLSLSPGPQFSVMIVDEAHHLRNPETSSYELAKFLCERSECALFLSATPVHLGSQNLYTLLNLLRPDLFLDEKVFDEMMEPNRYFTVAMRHVRSQRPELQWQQEACGALDKARMTSWGQSALSMDTRFTEWVQRLREGQPLSDLERVACVRDLEDVHTLAHIMNRTRRRDIGRFTIREPHTVSVPFTSQQHEFYETLIEFRRQVLSLSHDPLIVRFITDTLERQASSCLPALTAAINGFIRTGRFRSSDITDDPEIEDQLLELPPKLQDMARNLRDLAAGLPTADPKFDRFAEILDGSVRALGSGKVLVFSFFLHTLHYLERRLREHQYRVALVTGQTPDEERERLRAAFRMPRGHEDAIDVLLSSEVGCEGLDYEFCDRLVNYDIPWNPMRIEQRIGRIDRFGQLSEKILIFNFITPGTIEERIFFRCFERLGIFRDTVGDLEEVLGDMVQAITRAALDPTLTSGQAEAKAQQVADNALRHAEEQRRLEEESSELLGLDQALIAELEAMEATGRFVSPSDLRQMVSCFLERAPINARLSTDQADARISRLRLTKEGRSALVENLRSLESIDRPTTRFIHQLEAGDGQLAMTFDQDLALERRDLPFITPIHPLAKLAVQEWSSGNALVSYLVARSSTVRRGLYVFSCDIWETLAVNPEVRLNTMAWHADTKSFDSDVSSVLLRLISSAERGSTEPDISTEVLELGLDTLNHIGHEARLAAITEVKERNSSLVTRKLASLDTYYQHRLLRVEQELKKAAEDRIRRMKESERDRIQREYSEKRLEIESRSDADVIAQRIAVGLLSVQPEEPNVK